MNAYSLHKLTNGSEFLDLLLPYNTPNSAVSLTWPCNIEASDSFIKLWIYDFATSKLIYPHSMTGFRETLLRKLRNVDYRKMLISQLHLYDNFIVQVEVLRYDGIGRVVDDVLFYCIPPSQFHKFDVQEFYQAR